jgi:hypothetical protein
VPFGYELRRARAAQGTFVCFGDYGLIGSSARVGAAGQSAIHQRFRGVRGWVKSGFAILPVIAALHFAALRIAQFPLFLSANTIQRLVGSMDQQDHEDSGWESKESEDEAACPFLPAPRCNRRD